MVTKEQAVQVFIHFLRKKRVYKSFVENACARHKCTSIDSYFDRTTSIDDFVMNGFGWSSFPYNGIPAGPLASTYWGDIDDEWRRYWYKKRSE